MGRDNLRVVLGLTLAVLVCHASFAQSGDDRSNLESMKLTEQAVESINAQDRDDAMGKLDAALRLWPDNANAHFWMGFLARQRAATDPRSKDLAVRHLGDALRISPYGEFGRTVRAWLAKLIGRPSPVIVVMDTTGLGEGRAGQLAGNAATYLQPTGLIARRATGEACLGFGDLMSSMFIKQGKLDMRANTEMGYPFRFMDRSDLMNAARTVASDGSRDSAMEYGWIVALGPLQGLSVDDAQGNQKLLLPANLYASLSLTLIDPIDGQIVMTKNVSNDLLVCGLGGKLLQELTKKIPLVGELMGGQSQAVLLINSLAAEVQHSVARAKGRFQERELRDEVDVPLQIAGQTRPVWVRALGSESHADAVEQAVYRTPRQLLDLPRIAIAPPLCADVLGEQPVGDLIQDVASELVATGRCSVVSPSEIARLVETERVAGSKRPLLRCYETAARDVEAEYLLLTFVDDFSSSASSRNLVQCEVAVRLKGHWALCETASGNSVAQGNFLSNQSCTKFGDGGDRLLASLEASLQECRKSMMTGLLPVIE